MSLLVRESQGDGSAYQHDEGASGGGGVKSEGASCEETDSGISTLDSAVGQAQADGCEDPVAVFADGASQLDEGRQARALRPGAPAVEQSDDLVLGEVAGEDGAEGFFAFVGAPDRTAAAPDRGEAVGLFVRQVLGVFQQRPAGAFEAVGEVRLGAVAQLVPVGAADRVEGLGAEVGSDRGAVPAFPSVRFPGPPSEPGVRLSTHRALHKPMLWVRPLLACARPMAWRSSCPGSGSGLPRPCWGRTDPPCRPSPTSCR